MGYQVEGKLLEVCTGNVLCPCWVGEDTDRGVCSGVVSWQGRTLRLRHVQGRLARMFTSMKEG